MGLNATHSIKNYGIVSNTSNTGAKDSYGLAMDMMHGYRLIMKMVLYWRLQVPMIRLIIIL
mgnify:FL=1